jgi:hypothetical protein
VLQPWVMEFKILGPLEVWDAARRLHVRGTKRRAALALLVVNANENPRSSTLAWARLSPYPGSCWVFCGGCSS